MGMDIFGKRPLSKEGEYFRASVWSWRVIHHLCDQAISENSLPFNIGMWVFNEGEGLKAQEHCDLLADALDKYTVKHPPEIGIYEVDFGTSYVEKGTGRFVNRPGPNTESPYTAGVEHVIKFITFLRNCGGFEIR